MAESSFKISDLENIPVRDEKIALENTYFLAYSHTIHGMNYVTKNYKIPLETLRADLAKDLNALSGGIRINDDTIYVTHLKFNSKHLTISSAVRPESNLAEIDIEAPSIEGDEYISASLNDGKYKLSLNFDKFDDFSTEINLEEYPATGGNLLNIAQEETTNRYIIIGEDSNSLEINFAYYSIPQDNTTKISSTKFYINTKNASSNISLNENKLGTYTRWARCADGEPPSLKPNMLYCINFMLLPNTIAKNTSLENDSIDSTHIIIGNIEWFIPLS